MRYAARGDRGPQEDPFHMEDPFTWFSSWMRVSPGLVRLLHIFSPLSDAVLSLKWQDSNWNFPAGPSSLILSHDRFPAIIADQIERNSERDNVLEEKQAEVVHVMDAVNHDGVIRSRDQHGTCGEEHAD